MKSGINLCLVVSISVSVSSTNLFKKAVNLEISPQFDAYTGVRILTGIQDEDGNDILNEIITPELEQPIDAIDAGYFHEKEVF